mgnify:FL=1
MGARPKRPRVFHLAVFASGNGSNFERLVEACRNGDIPDTQVVCLICERPCPALERAGRLGVAAYAVAPGQWATAHDWSEVILKKVQAHGVDIIALAGYLKKIEEPLLGAYREKILNIHPALLPRHGGPGMYGRRVHESVLRSGDKETGVTVHVVDGMFDHGRIVRQEKIPVLPEDTPLTLAARVHELEYETYPKAIREFLSEL